MKSQPSPKAPRLRVRGRVLPLLGLAAALCTVGTTAQSGRTLSLAEAADAYPNFDIRLDKAVATTDQRAFLEQYSAPMPSASLAAAAAAEETARRNWSVCRPAAVS
jgi:hypothetical protein